MKVKISIIIPIYKVEKYLRRCLDSVINQTLKEIEIILIDDGSPDSSGKICDEYAGRDSRIKVIHKTNQGCSAARNQGMDIAQGEYIGFVDSDDYIDKNMYAEMWNGTLEGKNHVVETGFYEETAQREYREKYPHEFGLTANVWNKIFRKDIIEKYSLKFPENTHLGEDLAFVLKFFSVAPREKIKKIEKCCYYYMYNEGSGVTSNLERRFDIFKSLKDVIQFNEQNNLELPENFSETVYWHSLVCPVDVLIKHKDFEKNYFRFLRNIYEFRRYIKIREKFKILNLSYIVLVKRKIKIFLMGIIKVSE